MAEQEEVSAFDLPESNALEVVDKIYALAQQIRNDWNDPRSECRTIYKLCDKLKTMIGVPAQPAP
jgi:hypothetical protein